MRKRERGRAKKEQSAREIHHPAIEIELELEQELEFKPQQDPDQEGGFELMEGVNKVPPERTLREMMFPNNNNFKALGITLPMIADKWELRLSFIKILPKFFEMPGNNPLRHLEDFELVCGSVQTNKMVK